MSISVIINTYNSAQLLDKVLESVKDFDEVIVCDMESTDNTVEIAEQYGARVITYPKGTHTCCEPARNFAIAHAKSDWVLVVDSDEIVPQALRLYLYHYADSKHPADALFIPRKNFIFHRFRSAKYPDYQLRFFKAGVVDWPPFIHSVPVVKGTLSKIPANKMGLALIHIPHSIDVRLQMLNSHTTAEVKGASNKKVSLLGLTFKPLGLFLSSFILKGGFRYGIPGFIAAAHDANYRFYREAKIYESYVAAKIPTDIPDVPEEVLHDGEYGD